MIKIIYDDQSYTVLYTNSRNNTTVDIGYGDKHTSMEDHAQNLYELAAVLNAQAPRSVALRARVSMEKV